MRAVVIPGRVKVDPVGADEVHGAVFQRNAARPCARAEVLEPLRLTDATKRVANDRLDELKHPEGDPAISRDPVAEILAKLRGTTISRL